MGFLGVVVSSIFAMLRMNGRNGALEILVSTSSNKEASWLTDGHQHLPMSLLMNNWKGTPTLPKGSTLLISSKKDLIHFTCILTLIDSVC